LAEKAFRADAKAAPKIVGQFLKTCGNRVQVNCPFSLVPEFSHWKAKMGWLCGARQMQKNASSWSRQVKNFASAGIRPKRVYGFGTTECKVVVDCMEVLNWPKVFSPWVLDRQ
jgi:hypothetical protein